MGYFVKRRHPNTEGLVLPSGPTSLRPSTPAHAAMRYNTDSHSIEYFNGETNVYVDVAKTGNAAIQVDNLVGDGGAVYTMTQDVGAGLVPEEKLIVFIGGIYQTPTINYTATGTTITFAGTVPTAMEITVVHGAFGTLVSNSDVFNINP